jgi:nucleotide-binding universal stress UspA family protein
MNAPAFRRILLAVDRSPQSQNAVEVVADLAPRGAEVLVLHVWNLEVTDAHGWWDVETRHEAERLVDDFAARLTEAGLKASGRVRTGQTARFAREIVATAEEFAADLVAMGSRGRSDLGGLFLGSVSHEVVARTSRPVLIVRAAPDLAKANRRIVLALAGGEEVPSALRTTIAVARHWQADVVVLHVSRVMAIEAVAWVEPPEEAEIAADAAVRELKDAGIPARSQIITVVGPLADAIAEAAEGVEADLIVMGSRRLGQLRGLLTAATDHALVHRIETPILITDRRSEA